jgi:hypothetical protein
VQRERNTGNKRDLKKNECSCSPKPFDARARGDKGPVTLVMRVARDRVLIRVVERRDSLAEWDGKRRNF